MRRSRRCSENHSVAFGDQVVDGMMQIRKCHAKLPFKALEFVTVHRRGTDMADVAGGDEVVEAARKANIRKLDPATNQIFVFVELGRHFEIGS
jgi:hypothetical protein